MEFLWVGVAPALAQGPSGDPPGAQMPLKVIGTAFGRTGTDSMWEALNTLGFGPCHHMFEVSSSDIQRPR